MESGLHASTRKSYTHTMTSPNPAALVESMILSKLGSVGVCPRRSRKTWHWRGLKRMSIAAGMGDSPQGSGCWHEDEGSRTFLSLCQ
jgi:hypothetical protein